MFASEGHPISAPVVPGAQLWLSRYNGAAGGFDLASSVAVSADGGTVFVTGGSEGAAFPFDYDYATVAYSAATGGQLWASRYNGPGNGDDIAASVAVSPDGSTVFVTGSSAGVTSGADYATVAYNAASGAQLWASRYSGPGRGDDHSVSVAVSPNGRMVFVTGGSPGARSGRDYATVAHKAATGAQVWVRRYSGPVGFQNSASGLELVFYTAGSYSLMRPPRTARRLMRSWAKSATGWSGWGGWSWRVGAGNCVTLCDLGIFVDQAAEPIPPKDPGACAESRWMHAPGGRVLRQRGCAGALAPGASETSCQAAR